MARFAANHEAPPTDSTSATGPCFRTPHLFPCHLFCRAHRLHPKCGAVFHTAMQHGRVLLNYLVLKVARIQEEDR
eukprot:SAG11_NODE_32078_length_286_cov_1.363636_1_plen_74_part_01